jgi:rhamnose utilization protein RhaD (predicted bifunctional aldolase and dehydrogenase)
MSRAEITALCERWGSDRLLVQAAGGNVSWKDGDALWVKASGTWLAQAASKDIFVPVALADLRGQLQAGHFDARPRSLSDSPLRPSIETVLHALMPQRLVVHLHLVEALARLVRADGGDALALLRAQGLRCVEVPYRKPGAALAEAVSQALATTPADIVLMRNHGVVVGGETEAEVRETVEQVNRLLACPVQPSQAAASGGMAWPEGLVPVADPALHALATDSRLLARVRNDWALCPDHVVFLGPRAIVGVMPGELPELAFVPGQGVCVRAPLSPAKLAQLQCYHDVVVRQPDAVALSTLSGDDIAQLLDWDAERYRQAMSRD